MLDCMATCRGTDKKPCGNRLKKPSITQLVQNDLKAISGGDTISNILSNEDMQPHASARPLIERINASAISTFLVEPSSKGNILPLCLVTGIE